jgi:uncharacterized protein YfeS
MDLNCTDVEELKSSIKDFYYGVIQDNAIWGVAFGQLAIKGKIDEDLKTIAKSSLERQKLDIFLNEHNDKKRIEHIIKMQEVLDKIT